MTSQPLDPAPSSDDPTVVAPTPTTAVAPPGGNRGTSRGRWLAALGASALVVAAAIGATVLLTGESPDAEALGWTPADSVMYAELRLDLPGDQRRQLGEFLSVFPGFDDQAILDQKLGEVMDRIVRGATDGSHDYRTDIEPWFDGQLAMSVGPLPDAPDTESATPRGLLLVGVEDEARARAWIGEVVAGNGGASRTEAYQDVEITLVEPPAQGADDYPAATGAYAVLGPVLALGDLASVKAAIDTGGRDGLGGTERFRAAAGSITGDHLGFVFMDTQALLDWSAEMERRFGDGGALSLTTMPALFDQISPDWMAGALRAEGDALVFESRTPHLAAISGDPANRASSLANLVPSDTLLLVASHDVAANLERVLALLRTDPEVAEGMAEIENVAGILGGIEGLTGWIGDLGVVVVPDGSGVSGGLVIDPSDSAAAERLLTTLRTFVTLAGASAGITIRDESHGGATVTVLTIEDAGALMDLAQGMGGGDAPSGDVPIGRVEIAYSVTDDVVVLGSSPSFVRRVLDAPAGDALADNPRFDGLVQRAGREHSGLFWLDVAGARGRIEGAMPADERDEYDREVRPYAEKLDAVLGTSVAGADVDASTIYVTVSE